MPPLAKLQALIRAAVVEGRDGPLAPLLARGAADLDRLAVHRRHYGASLARTVTNRFPAVSWAIGGETFAALAADYVRVHPPLAPCLAEYAGSFPAYLYRLPLVSRYPWLADLAALDWQLGLVALAVDEPALLIDALAGFAPEQLAELTVSLQSGTAYLAADWPVDGMVRRFLDGGEPDPARIEPDRLGLEIRGARGAFHFDRLPPTTFAFRTALLAGASLGAAAEEALDEGQFDPAAELSALFSDGLVTAVFTEGQAR